MKKNIWKRALSLVLCLVLVASYLPTGILTAVAEGTTAALNISKVADPSTMGGWDAYFDHGAEISTDNAGAIWTDKSVFIDASAFSNITTDSQGNPASITMTNPNDMLVALSAMASNMTITGQSSVPTDTMLVLDVSGSMNEGNNDVAEELAEAANTTIHELLTSNPHNRVGVVLYSGPQTQGGAASDDDAVLMLPLGRYTTGADKQYLQYGTRAEEAGSWWEDDEIFEVISLDSDVVIENTTTNPSDVSKDVVGATYIQKGIILAMNQFIATSNQTSLGGVTHKPILVLMSDGAPTVTDTDFINPGSYDLGDGTNNSTDAAQGFVTQLSCAYAKAKVEEKYATDALFYTIGLGTTGNQVATSVLDPKNSNSGIDTFWTRYQNAQTDQTILVEDNRGTNNDRYVTKISTALEQEYVDKYIAVTAGTDLAQGLKDAFKAIVADIQLQSKYFPTLVGSSHNLSGYVSFSDKIGAYMSVKDVKGILLHDQLFSGMHLAQNFVEGGGILGTEAEPKAAGTAMMESVRDRLGLGSNEAAIALINNAYYYGQLGYDAQAGTFSNYIGWYADARGAYMGFYQEGVTTLPADAVYTVKSYGFLGETDPDHGVSESDMMYATVQLRHNIATGEEEMILKIPASLIPTITYEVELDSDGKLKELIQSGAEHPFRLLYEVGLDPHINSLNVSEYVSAEYLAANRNTDGSVDFYTNQYEVDNSTGYGKVNTYSHFNPSHQNDKYYFQADAMVYSDQDGTLYTISTAPKDYNGTLYRQHVSYKVQNGQLVTDVHYHELAAQGRAAAVQTSGGNTWYVPEGTVYTNLSGFTYYKGYTSQYDAAKNLTDTLTYAKQPFVDVFGHKVDEVDHNFTVGSTLGNNGKLTVMPATGIKLTKAMAEGVADPGTAFTFTVENLINTTDSGTYAAVLEAADGTQTDTTVTFASGKATVELKVGQVLYITGLTAGTQLKITETETTDYVVASANGSAGNSTTVTVVANQMVAADFINTERGKGNLMITKEVAHAQAGHAIPESVLLEWFWVKVDLGSAFAGKDVQVGDGTTTGGWRVQDDGTLLLQIRHGQTLSILDLPEGTDVTVSEVTDNLLPHFKYDHINSRDHSGAELDNDGTVTIGNNTNSTVIVHNKYQPASTTADLDVKVTKNFITESALTENADFTFQVQQWNDEIDQWLPLHEAFIRYDASNAADQNGGEKTYTFTEVLKNISYTEAGDYAYQVVEIIPDNKLPGVTYDRTTWTFTVHVTDQDGQLVATITDDGDPVNGTYNVTFENTAHRAPVSIDVVKEVENTAGNAETPVAGFVFEAYEANDDWTLVENGSKMTVLSDAVGEARFYATYQQVGTHYFVVKEANESANKPGWSFDNTEYRIQVDVMDPFNDGDLRAGTMIQKVTYDENGTATVHNPVPGAAPIITFSNTYDPTDATANLDSAVTKNLVGRDLNAGEFTFAVFPNGKASHTSTADALLIGTNAADKSVNFSGTTTAVNAGTATADGSLLFSKIGTYEFDIAEITGNLGGVDYSTRIYDLVVEVTDNGSGQLSANWYFEDATSQTVTFTNTYSADETSYTVKGNKTLTGRNQINDEFTFTMTEVADANGTALSGAQTWQTTNAMDGTFTFPAITYTTTGTHYYKVSEVQQATAGGITFDENSYIITVTVTDNGAGQLVATASENANNIAFTNHYVPAKTSGDIPGTKTLEGKVLGAGAYSFQLYNSNANWENLGANGQPVPNDEHGKFTFPKIEYTTAGSYYYLVKEVNGGQIIDGVTYDDATFRVQVTVTDDLKGQLHAETVVFDEDDIPQIGVEFVNIYQVTGDLGLVVSGSKKLEGRDQVDGEFTFELYNANDKYEESGDPIATALNKDGMYAITLNYTAKDDLGKTYYYVLKEKNAGKPPIKGVTYTETEHQIKVTLSDNGNGTMGMEVTTDGQKSTVNNVTTVTGLNFTNKYAPAAAPITFSGTKDFEGNGMRDLNANDFTFELYKANAQFVIDGAALTTITNAANGNFEFVEQKIATAGTHYFVIKERSTNPIKGVIYDTALYQATVVVRDDLAGQLHVDSIAYQKVTSQGTTNATAIVFENTYDPEDATVAISGKKTLEGRALNSNDTFTFQLYKTDSSFSTAGVTPVEKDMAQNGTYAFDTLTFDAEGTYYYVVTEKNAGQKINGVTYDDTRYKLTIKVEDDENGKLIPTVETAGGSVSVIGNEATVELNFRNTYAAAATIPADLTGGKTVFGDWDLKAGDFTFQMFQANDQFVIQGTAYKTATNDVNGDFVFTDISFETAGMHYLVIKESSDNPINGMTYDPAVYHMSVEVTDDGKGQLFISGGSVLKITPEGTTTPNELLFTNSYDAEDATLSLSGKKVLEGKDLTDGEFTFMLQQTDDKFVPWTGAGVVPKQTVNSGESFTFDALTYDTVGTYYYIVTEVDTENERVTFDETVYQVTVKVTDENGVLKAVASYTKDGKAVDEMVFTNVYTPKPADLPLTFQIQKTVKNIGKETIGPEGFTFVLEENTDAKVEATTDKDGKAVFNLTATEDMIGHTFKLKLYEKNDGKAHVTYSTAVHEITVTIRLGSDNKLVADLTVDGNAVKDVNVAFENVYDYTVPATPVTGDSTPVALLFGLLAVSAMALAAAVIFRKKIIC